ncbi:MAG TPA: 5-formyltetrahydrofolate cyclo-ligase [Desulfotomaculum sp.]|nr:MAG: 5-formyltetrahydrofolate cyclo-ligase [Peptococcaceae bacterium BRH_c8a]KJS70504.1 MAG: 5-formyltetrahydrofolate cyclo-ligase [Desulfotomaculum sp. BICA1-6]HBX24102.1 5-formyltetrahydrofolate cyclo-ligase [Desulfotomaculum sp.]
MSKNELRKSVIVARNRLAAEKIKDNSSAVASRLIKLEEYLRAGTIMAYVDFRNEVQTEAIIRDALNRGKTVVVPITDVANKKLTPSQVLNYPDDLAPGAWNILEPRPECVRPVDPGTIDLVIVPGVAFDTAGNRLGYGGGFYDRFLLNTKPDCLYAALAYEMQIKPNVYPGEHDLPVHLLVTEKRVLDLRANIK